MFQEHFCSGDKCVINDTFLRSLLCVYLVRWLFTEDSASLPPTAQSSSFWKDLGCDQNSSRRSSPVSSSGEVNEGTIYAAELWESKIGGEKEKRNLQIGGCFLRLIITSKLEKFHLDIMENMSAYLWAVFRNETLNLKIFYLWENQLWNSPGQWWNL